MNGTLLLVNRDHPLAQEPGPGVLVPVSGGDGRVRLHARAKAMLDQLLRAVDGETAIVPVSGYRPRAEQRRIWDDALAEHGAAFTETYVARPGCSEHQTGLAIDLGENVPEVDFLCPSFPDRGPCGALRRRAADFGFVLRYPKGKEAVTGIGHEPWHFRYVGWPHARIMEDRGLVLEEYLALLRRYPAGGEPLWYRGLGRVFSISYLPAGAPEPPVPVGALCQRSDTNEGGAVLTLWRDGR